MEKKIRVGLVGCGVIAKNHLVGLLFVEGAEVVALCDIKKEKAQGLAESFGLGAKIYSDYLEMLDAAELDAVHICTPHYLHAQMAIEALRRDIYPLLEKPMCINHAEMEMMLAEEKKSRAKCAVCFQNRFSPSVIKALEIARNDGGAITGYATVMWDRGEKYYTESGWRGSMRTEGGGVMINQVIHALDLLFMFLGKPSSVIAKTENYHLRGIIDVEDSCDGIITHEDGRTSNFYATTAARGMCSTVVYIVTKNHTVEVRNYKLFVDGEPVDTSETQCYVGKACYGNGHTPLIAAFYDAVKNRREMPVTLESAKEAVNILLAAYASRGEKTEIAR